MRRVGFCYRSPSTGLRGAIRRSNADGFLDFMSCTCLICPGAEDRLAGDIRPVSAWLFDQSECGDGRCGMPQADKREGRQVRARWSSGQVECVHQSHVFCTTVEVYQRRACVRLLLPETLIRARIISPVLTLTARRSGGMFCFSTWPRWSWADSPSPSS